MNDIASGARTNDHSLLPILALEGQYEPYFTPFNFIPFEFAYQAYKLQILSSVPFGLFQVSKGKGQSLLIEYTCKPASLSRLARHLSKTRRPIVLWISNSNKNRIRNLIISIQACVPLLFLIIVEDSAISNFISALISENPLASVICLDSSNEKEDERPLLIWKAYLELFVKLENLIPTGGLLMNLPPDRSMNKKFSDLLSSAQTGDISDITLATNAIPLFDDFIYYPNAIIANFLRYKIPKWIKGPVPQEENNTKVYEYSREILERKSLSLLIDQVIQIRNLINEKKQLPESILKNFFLYDKLLPKEFFQPLLDISRGLKTTDEMKSIYSTVQLSYPKDVFYTLSFPHFVLICQSYPFDYNEITNTNGGALEYRLMFEKEDDKELYSSYFEQIIKGGRAGNFALLEDDEINRNAVKALVQFSRMESNHLSALSVFYGLRRMCPVFKTQRVGRPIFTLFHKLDQRIRAHDNPTIGETTNEATKDLKELELLMYNLSERLTELIDPQILAEMYSCNREPRVFLLSDIPLDFVRTQLDYFGYTAILNRLPVTPGQLPLEYYNMTESLTELDNEAGQSVIVTSFQVGSQERKMLEMTLETFHDKQSVQILNITSRFELINYVNNNRNIKCLIFFGHGGLERDLNKSWIELPHDNFFNSDIEKLQYVPKTVVLIGCNTSSGGNTLSGMDIPFLHRGAQVIATTFPIPLILGTLFIGMFLSNFLSAGVNTSDGTRFYIDLSDILTVVKRRLRINSILLNLSIQGRLKNGQENEVLNKYYEKMEELEEKDMGNDVNPFIAIKRTLLELGLIDSVDIPFYEIEKIPYCLFFTCLGHTWHNVNKNFKI